MVSQYKGKEKERGGLKKWVTVDIKFTRASFSFFQAPPGFLIFDFIQVVRQTVSPECTILGHHCHSWLEAE